MRNIITILFILLLLVGCRTVRQSTVTDSTQSVTRLQTDSIVIREREKIERLTIPTATASLSIDPQALLHLPAGAAFTQQSGRASITVSRDSFGNIYAQARCDSLELLYTSLYTEYRQFKAVARDSIANMYERLETVKELSSWDVFWVKFGRICAIIVVLLIVFFIMKWKLKF